MSADRDITERVQELEFEIECLKKINHALVGRVERSTDTAGSAFSLFESNILLQQRVVERTQELQQSNATLQEEIHEHERTETELRNSQRQTRLIIDTALDAVIAFDKSWNILDWNPRAEVTFGYTTAVAKECLGVATLISTIDHEQFAQYLEEQKSTDADHNEGTIELIACHRDGHQFPIEIAVSILIPGESPVFSAFIRDITERKLADEARYRELFDNSPVSLREEDYSEVKCYIDDLVARGHKDLRHYFSENPKELQSCIKLIRIMDANIATLTLFKAQDKQQFQEHFSRIYAQESMQLMADTIVLLASGAANYATEATLRKFDGQQVRVAVSLSISPGQLESWSKVFVSVLDVTDRWNAENERSRLEAQLQHAQKMDTIGTLAGGIAHDFNNMLTPIIGYADIIKDSVHDEAAILESAEHVISAATRARDLVRQILAFSRHVEHELKPVKPYPIIKEALELLRASLPSTASIVPRLDQSAHVVMADATQIHQIVLNLCTNAFQALNNSVGTIEVGLRNVTVSELSTPIHAQLPAGNYVCLSVTDTGCGIKSDDVNRIFEPFFTTKRVGEGTGMGLSVTHGIVRKHNGEIFVESVLGLGSSFYIYLPSVFVEPCPAVTAQTIMTGQGHILVVDDEPLVAGITKKLLERLGYSTTMVTDSRDALQLFQSSPMSYDAIVTDQTMPFLAGHLLAKSAQQIRPGIPILLLTGFSEEVTEENFKSFGICEMLMKPSPLANLSQALHRAFGNKTFISQ